MRPFILAVTFLEGPAGAGKSYYASSHRGDYDVIVDQRSSTKRAKDGVVAFAEHLLRWGVIGSHLLESERDQLRVLVDRSLLGQWVYGNLRGEGKTDLAKLCMLFASLNGLNYGRLLTEISFLFILPPLEVLEERRSRSGKDYPYPAEKELELYDQLALFIARFLPVETISQEESR